MQFARSKMSNAVKRKSNHLHTVEHVVQSTFQNMLITFLSTHPTTLILSSLVSEFGQRIQIFFFFFFFWGGGGGGGEGSGPPILLQIFIKIFWHNHIIIFWFLCLISRSKVSLRELHINPYQALQKDSLYCPSSTILCYF